MKWLKIAKGKVLYFMKLFLYYFLFGENSIGSTYVPLHSVCFNQIMKKQNSNQNVKACQNY